ncbi:hypothetical protein L3Q65_00140 (plasmid) [Amycolatopsis sp. FU40]|uniref:hypothetical protein n=1 Tax=Amycolatopsis sp. FU40 TaxID=2914159 RepID=UPI001F1B872D|nr:hypothetical protein [Amycolatopsis sp. FU40]UKD50768.1 hypothetical protein L3Q65_00140 [Amycolatopsis sp. FU40]
MTGPEPSYASAASTALDQAVLAGVASGDLTEVDRVIGHMVAEGPAGISRDWLLAVALLKLRMEAEHQGMPAMAAAFQRTAAAECSAEAIRMAGLTTLLVLGDRRGGWLTADEHDQAAALATAEFPELLPKVRRLERRETPETR